MTMPKMLRYLGLAGELLDLQESRGLGQYLSDRFGRTAVNYKMSKLNRKIAKNKNKLSTGVL